MKAGRSYWRAAGAAALLVALVGLAPAEPADPADPFFSPASEQTAALQAALADLRAGRLEQAAASAEMLATNHADPYGRAWIVAAAARRQLNEPAAAAEAYRGFMACCGDDTLRQYVLNQIALCEQGSPAAPVPPSRTLSARQREELAVVEPAESVAYGPRFTVRSHNAALSQLVVDLAELTLRRISQDILRGADYPHQVEVHIFPTPADYAVRQQADSGEQRGGFELTFDDTGQVRRTIYLIQQADDGRFDLAMLDRVLPHELCHLVTAEWFGDAHCPLYLQEGLAMASEYDDGAERILLAGAAVAADALPTVAELVVRERVEPNDQALYYAQSYSLTVYLHQRMSASQFADFLSQIKTGCTLVQALHRALCLPQDDQFLLHLEQAWREDAVAQAQFISALTESAGYN